MEQTEERVLIHSSTNDKVAECKNSELFACGPQCDDRSVF